MGKVVELIVAKLSEIYKTRVTSGGECRIIVPGITTSIALEIHKGLGESGVDSLLVIHNAQKDILSSEEERIIYASTLTSHRLGSFFAVCLPGVISSLHDSEKGPGAPFKDFSYNEEWPWQKKSLIEFQWNNFLEEIICTSGISEAEIQWILDAFEVVLPTFSKLEAGFRQEYLFKNVLEKKFTSPVSDSFIQNLSLPYDSEINFNDYYKSYSALVKHIILRIEHTEFERANWIEENLAKDLFPNLNSKEIIELLDELLDCIYESKYLPNTLLFSEYYSKNPFKYESITLDILKKLFDLPTKDAEFKIIDLKIHDRSSDFNTIKPDLKEVVVFEGERLQVEFSFNVSDALNPELLVKKGAKEIQKVSVDPENKNLVIDLEITDELVSSARQKISFTIFEGKTKLTSILGVYIYSIGPDRASAILVEDGEKVFGLHNLEKGDEINHDTPELIDSIDVAKPVFCTSMFYSDNDKIRVVAEDGVDLIASSNIGKVNNSKIIRYPKTKVGITPQNKLDNIFLIDTIDGMGSIKRLEFSSQDIVRGNYNLFDEYIEAITNSSKSKLEALLLSIENKQIYSNLGSLSSSEIDRKRITNGFEFDENGKINSSPILLDISKIPIHLERFELTELGTGLRAIKFEGKEFGIPQIFLNKGKISDECKVFIDNYNAAKTQLLNRYKEVYNQDSFDRPLSCLIHLDIDVENFEELVMTYLKSYISILDYLINNQSTLDRLESSTLTYLDSIVIYKEQKEIGLLRGPWHPLNFIKNLLLYRNIKPLLKKAFNGKYKNKNHRLAVILKNMKYFAWDIAYVSSHKNLNKAYSYSTSDIGFTYSHISDQVLRNNRIDEVSQGLMRLCGLEINSNSSIERVSINSILGNYIKLYPWVEKILVKTPKDYNLGNELQDIDKNYNKEKGIVLGGIHLVREGPISQIIASGYDWSEKSNLYLYDQIPSGIKEYDIELLADTNEVRISNNGLQVLRGAEDKSIFYQPFIQVTKGMQDVPDWVLNENEQDKTDTNDPIITLFLKILSTTNNLGTHQLLYSVNLPSTLQSTWAVLPGGGIDSQVIIQYINESEGQSAIWDFKLKLDKSFNKYYTISEITDGLIDSIRNSAIFDGYDEDYIRQLVTESSGVGISVGQESMLSDIKSNGVIGLFAAINSLIKGSTPFYNTENSAGFLLSVDSFREILGQELSDSDGVNKRFCDFIAIQLFHDDQGINISCAAIECKHSLSPYTESDVAKALSEQSKLTYERFITLIEDAKKEDGLLERLALKELLDYGLKISGHAKKYQHSYQAILTKIIDGTINYLPIRYPKILFITEPNSQSDKMENRWKEDGLYYRFSKSNWPHNGLDGKIINSLFYTALEKFKISENKVPTVEHDDPSKSDSLNTNSSNNDTKTQPVKVSESSSENLNEGEKDQNNRKQNIQILLGKKVDQKNVYFDPLNPNNPLTNLNLMMTGSSGRGKTQLIKSIVVQLRQANINTILIDFKNDFSEDMTFIKEANLNVQHVTFGGLQYNPLIPTITKHPTDHYDTINLSEHINGLANVFQTTFGLGEQMSATLKSIIRDEYKNHGISPKGNQKFNPSMKFPNLDQVGVALENENRLAYNRLDPIFDLGLFLDENSQTSFGQMIKKSQIINLSRISSDAVKGALSKILMMSAHGYYNAKPHRAGQIVQYFIFDEAHRVLDAEFMEKFIRECRAYGVGVLLSSQNPSDFPNEISSSLATKIIHGNGADMDKVRAIGKLLGKTADKEIIAQLGLFDSIVNNEQYDNTYIKTYGYASKLVITFLKNNPGSTSESLSNVDGIDQRKLEGLIVFLLKNSFIEKRGDKFYINSALGEFI